MRTMALIVSVLLACQFGLAQVSHLALMTLMPTIFLEARFSRRILF